MRVGMRVGLTLAVIVMMVGCAERHEREDNNATGHSMECDPSVYGSPCCAICHVEPDAGGLMPRFGLPDDAGL